MKTYAFDSIEVYSRFSEFRNLKKLICNKIWRAFSEESESETYSFMGNGTVMISHEGHTVKGTWKYDVKEKVLELGGKNKSHSFRMVYFDRVVMVLNVKGSAEYVFLINANNDRFFEPRRYTDILAYFKAKDDDVAKAIEEAAKVAQQTGNLGSSDSEAFKARVQEKIDRDAEERLMEEADELAGELTCNNRRLANMAQLGIFALVYICVVLLAYFAWEHSAWVSILDMIIYGTMINIVMGFSFVNRLIEHLLDKLVIKLWKKNHPKDSRNKYL